ncbi:MAG: DUF1385 domain-containing protein [Oscillospiraceae bacterium]|nr:DUF1385 domain-containing protein [Oscillospiraceae bacterium]
MTKEKDKIHRTSIGGQAVIEGVMMRGPKLLATAVRKPDGEIIVDEKDVPKSRTSKIVKLPIIRGCVGFFDSMVMGVKALMFSASFFDLEEDDDGNETPKEPSRFEAWLERRLGNEKAISIVMYISLFFSLIIGIGMFMLLPAVIVGFARDFIAEFAGGFIENEVAISVILTLIEGIIRISIFLAYLILVSQMKDIKRVFAYHGAEHKAIACYENGDDLTVENVKKHSRFHPRCGTSFLLIVMVVSVLVFSFISWDNWYIRLGLRLALLPVVAGLSYEIIKFAGRHSNPFTRAISAPGISLQRITTREPEDDQIEVAVAALIAVMPESKEDDKW